MPQVTVYIREEDLEAWRGVIKKSEFMHNALHDRSTYDGAKIVLGEELPPVVESVKAPSVYTSHSVSGFTPAPPDPELGYPCCQKNKPCKHWQWDGVQSAYVNELTGKVREVV